MKKKGDMLRKDERIYLFSILLGSLELFSKTA